ncbi:MAG: protein kinase, partial [Myxococcota bacterium]
MTTDGEPRRSCELVPSPATGSLSGVRRIGEGGSAEVFAAVWRGREVAMKVAKPGTFEDARDKERFLEEAQRLSRIDHPGVIEVLDTGELPDGRPY